MPAGRPKKTLQECVGKMMFSKKYNKAIGEFICQKIEEGLNISEIYDKYKDMGMVEDTTIWRWRKKFPEFRIALDYAYQTYFYKLIEELDNLSKSKLDENMPRSEVNAELARRKIRVDALKFMLVKIAPKIVQEFRDSPAVAVQIAPVIEIVRYERTESTPKLP